MEILNYKKYLNLVKEGLIITHNIQIYKNSLEIELKSIGVEFEIKIISKFIYDIDILNSDKLSEEQLHFIININQNLLGYYPSYIWVELEDKMRGFPFDIIYLSNKFSKIKVRFESKYDDKLYKNDIEIPDIAYHLSPTDKKYKILKNGLYPKSYNRKTKHPDRIYFFYDMNDYKYLLKSLKLNDKINNLYRNYSLYKVKLTQENIIHSDPNFSKGFYTYDNISPMDIELIEDEL